MIISFRGRGGEDIYNGVDTRVARRTLPRELHERACRVLDQINAAVSLQSLSLPGLRLEKLRGDRAGQYSVRINAQYRICFEWTDLGPAQVEIVDYH